MSTTTRAPSPWTGSEHRATHRWQLDTASNLAEVSSRLQAIASELTAAHAAGWSLSTPMRRGDLHATRPSRRQRNGTGILETQPADPPPIPQVRVRVIDEPPVTGLETFDPETTAMTSVVRRAGDQFTHVGGPPLAADLLTTLRAQLPATQGVRRWAVLTSQMDRVVDAVAEGSALRQHAVRHGALVRTHDTLAFHHIADGSRTLLESASIYQDLANSVDAMADLGARLVESDDGFVTIDLHGSAS